MRIAYGTYAMPTVPLEEAFPALAQMGYDGVEICVSPNHVGSMPDQMDASRRGRLRDQLGQNGLEVPALFLAGHIYTENPEEHRATLDHLRVCAQLARDLGLREPPVLAIGLGGRSDQWESSRDYLVRLLRDYAELAEQEDFVLAGEAHFGAAVDRVERVVWLFDAVNHPRVRLHFDIVHMFLAGEPLAPAVRALVPYTAHTHITDARKHPDGSFDLLLLGQGDLDTTTYVRAMHEAGWDDFITLEVSMRVWSRPEYDPFTAARFCYGTLRRAFEEAGVRRG
jgi:sugar phosphate isomerase/epimerase